jgi:hypothetical protein
MPFNVKSRVRQLRIERRWNSWASTFISLARFTWATRFLQA